MIRSATRDEMLQPSMVVYDKNRNNNKKKTATPLKKSPPLSSFCNMLQTFTNGAPEAPRFDKTTRQLMEPYVSDARHRREEYFRRLQDSPSSSRLPCHSSLSALHIPYPTLRTERPFLFDIETYPLHKALSDVIDIDDLSELHNHPIQDPYVLFQSMFDRNARRPFHLCYDNFVTSFCIPLLHALAMTQNLFVLNNNHEGSMSSFLGGSERGDKSGIRYRYQAFPSIRLVRPGESSSFHHNSGGRMNEGQQQQQQQEEDEGDENGERHQGDYRPQCDISNGYSIGNINFHIPLTPTFGTNSIYVESHTGREDWHPLTCKKVGLGYVFDGARCLRFGMVNTTDKTAVALDFRIAISRGVAPPPSPTQKQQSSPMPSPLRHRLPPAPPTRHYDDQYDDVEDVLCKPPILNDQYSSSPGYYDDAYIDLSAGSDPTSFVAQAAGPVVIKGCMMNNSFRRGYHNANNNGVRASFGDNRLLDPDERVGFPFS